MSIGSLEVFLEVHWIDSTSYSSVQCAHQVCRLIYTFTVDCKLFSNQALHIGSSVLSHHFKLGYLDNILQYNLNPMPLSSGKNVSYSALNYNAGGARTGGQVCEGLRLDRGTWVAR